MSPVDRRHALKVTLLGGICTILAAVITGILSKKPAERPAAPEKLNNHAETKGDQSPAVSGAKGDVSITYGNASDKKQSRRK